MPLPGPDGGMERQGKRLSRGDLEEEGRDWEKWGLKEERMTAVRGRSEKRDEACLFLTLPSLSEYDGLPSKRPAGIEHCWSPFRLTSWPIALSLSFFPSARLPGSEGDFSIPVLFRLYQSPKRQMNSWSLLFHDNNHLVSPHIRLNLCYTSLQINLCQPLFDSPHTLSVCVSPAS